MQPAWHTTFTNWMYFSSVSFFPRAINIYMVFVNRFISHTHIFSDSINLLLWYKSELDANKRKCVCLFVCFFKSHYFLFYICKLGMNLYIPMSPWSPVLKWIFVDQTLFSFNLCIFLNRIITFTFRLSRNIRWSVNLSYSRNIRNISHTWCPLPMIYLNTYAVIQLKIHIFLQVIRNATHLPGTNLTLHYLT